MFQTDEFTPLLVEVETSQDPVDRANVPGQTRLEAPLLRRVLIDRRLERGTVELIIELGATISREPDRRRRSRNSITTPRYSSSLCG